MAPDNRTRSRMLAGIGIGAGAALVAAGLVGAAGGLAPSTATAEARPPANPPPLPSEAYVELYDEKELQGRKLTLRPGTDIRSLDGIADDGGMDGFEDLPASVRWNIPVGWQLVLFEHKNFEGHRLELKGTGRAEETHDLGCFTDTASSARWEHRP